MKYYEYQQQLDYLKMSVEQIKELMDSLPFEYAYIIHDKDTNDDGTPKEKHIHLMVKLFNTTTNKWDDKRIEEVARFYQDSTEHIQKPKFKKNSWNNMLSYLVHQTSTSNGEKYQYNPTEVVANFDYCKKLEDIINEIKDTKKYLVNEKEFLDKLFKVQSGEILQYQIPQMFTDIERIKKYNDIKIAIKNYHDSIKEKDRNMQVIYIQGASGTFKTTFAKYLAKIKYNGDYYLTGSSNDMLQDYLDQPVVILDDIRGSDVKFSDFLKLLDPHTGSTFKSRYFNKNMLNCKCMILTSVFAPGQLYEHINESQKEPLNQLIRRINDKYVSTYNDGNSQFFDYYYNYPQDNGQFEMKKEGQFRFPYKDLEIVQRRLVEEKLQFNKELQALIDKLAIETKLKG